VFAFRAVPASRLAIPQASYLPLEGLPCLADQQKSTDDAAGVVSWDSDGTTELLYSYMQTHRRRVTLVIDKAA
jgi:hypothetical protein